VPLHAERGRGLYLVRSLVDDTVIRSNDAGTVVRVRKELPDAPRAQSPR